MRIRDHWGLFMGKVGRYLCLTMTMMMMRFLVPSFLQYRTVPSCWFWGDKISKLGLSQLSCFGIR